MRGSRVEPAGRGSFLAQPLIGLVKLYRLVLSPFVGGSCRFHPSCSEYALQALTRFGALQGTALAAVRLLRCNPFCESGVDPVPDDGAIRWRRSVVSAGPAAPPTLSR